ncbi:Tn3 family transposase [Sphingomonas sp. PAMC 26621]|uniref:Tn3 family transposase n=1 Tax=Sphingomonas sp. PAMC 26621 TaxID=1112213 RepID=UPI00028802F7|nr:Tn3 family transposase [Sphingomonas sp. PAMC 26621]
MPRRSVLTEAQRANLLALPEDEADLVRYWTLSADDLRIVVSRRRAHNRLGFAIQLCGLRYPGRLLRPGELIPHAPLAFVGEQLGIEPQTLAEYATRGPTRYEQLDALRDVFGFRSFCRPVQAELQAWLLPVALTTTSGPALTRMLLDEVRRRRIIVPGITPVERMVGKALLDSERHVADLLTQKLTVAQRDRLDALLLKHDERPVSVLTWVRQPPGKPGRRAFAAILDRLTVLRAIELDADLVSAIHPERLRRLCQEGARLTAQHLTSLNPARRRAVLVAAAIETQVALTDDAVLMFERLFGQLFRRAERREEAALKRDRRTINGKIRLLARLGEAIITARASDADPLAAIEGIIGWDDLATEVDEARRLVRPDPLDPVELSRSNAPILRQVGPAFITTFTFGAVPACAPLARAVAIMRDLGSGRLRKLPTDVSLGFVRATWRRRIDRAGLDRRTFEFCVLAELRDRLRAGDMWVEGSRRYRAVEQQLISAPVFAAMRAAGPLPVPVGDTAGPWLAERRALLAQRVAEVEEKASANTLEDVLLAGGRLRISPLRAITPDEAEGALSPLYAHLPAIRITDLLADVDRWTGFASCFTHLTHGRAHDDPRAVLTAILADATNLGHARMAEACGLMTERQLGWLSAWHLREDSYGAALARLAETQHRMPLAARFGDGTASSSDGQNFPLDRRAQATGAINPHKSSEPAVSFYTHVSDRYAPLHSTVISAGASEAAHVLDGLLHHGADLAIECHHTDGGGVSDHVFSLCHLLGFRFAPRIPNISARRLHLFADMRPGPDIAPLVAQPIDEGLIAGHWDDVIRLATSIRTGVTSASVMLERLGSYPRANGLALALREIGRVERTLFTLDWIERPEERRRATRELNKGEAQNALKRAIFFHRTGRIRDQGLQEQTHRASALNLVAGAIVLWNTTYLEAVMRHLEQQGRPVPSHLLQHLSPLGWQHINLTGDYLWTDADIPDGKLRGLRQALRSPG